MNKTFSCNTTSSESNSDDPGLTGSSTDKPKTTENPSNSEDKNSTDPPPPPPQDPTPIQSLRAKFAPIVRGLRGAARFFQRHNPFRHDKRSKKIHPQISGRPTQSWRVGDLFCILPHESDDESQPTCAYTIRTRLSENHQEPVAMVRLNRDTGTPSEYELDDPDWVGSSSQPAPQPGSTSPSLVQAILQSRLKEIEEHAQHLEEHLPRPTSLEELCQEPRFRRCDDAIVSSKSDPVDLGMRNSSMD